MKRMFAIMIAVAGLVAASIPANADEAGALHVVSGSFLVGNPTAYALADACTTPTDGVDSSCVDLPQIVGGLWYVTEAVASLDPAAVTVCFYSGGGILGCDPATVPEGATRMSVSAMGGAMIEWTVTFA